MRRKPIEDRKHKLSRLVRTPRPGIVVNEHYDGDGETVFKYACKLGCEGIVMCAWRGNTVEIGDIQRISATAKAFASIRSGLLPISAWIFATRSGVTRAKSHRGATDNSWQRASH